MIELASAIAALTAYRAHLKSRGQLVKAIAVGHCIVIIRRLQLSN